MVDFGCAECKLLRLLKRELYIESLVGVDIDPVPLSVHSALVHPLITDHLHPRPHPFHMALMEGKEGVEWKEVRLVTVLLQVPLHILIKG